MSSRASVAARVLKTIEQTLISSNSRPPFVMDSKPDGIPNEVFKDYNSAKFHLKLSQIRYLEPKILREAWTEICLPEYEAKGATSKAEAFRQEFRRLRDAVRQVEHPLRGLGPEPAPPNDKNLQAAIHDLLSNQLGKTVEALEACGDKESGDRNLAEKVERVCGNVAVLEEQLQERKLQYSKTILELAQSFHEEVDKVVSAPELGEGANELLKNWRQLKNVDLRMRKKVAESTREVLTPEMMETYNMIKRQTRKDTYSLEKEMAEMKRTLVEFNNIQGDDVKELVDDYRDTRVAIEGYRVALAKQRAVSHSSDPPAATSGDGRRHHADQ